MEIELSARVERWGCQELKVKGPCGGNPFTEQWISAQIDTPCRRVTVPGFYNGNGEYIVRFMPQETGLHTARVTASFLQEPLTASFTAEPAGNGNHGPVRVAEQYHFAYEDGTPYQSVGTTCYVWALQSDALIEQTLDSLKEAGFNKIRFCVFPKHYVYNLHEPRSYPFEGKPMDSSVLTVDNFGQYIGAAQGNEWDLTRFNPDHFTHLEGCILALQRLGIEADIIIMHPYDRWGFSCMPQEANDRYWHYLIARFAAYRNVWWSLANEYDLMPAMKTADWDRLGEMLAREDPYHHLRSIHNCGPFYDHNRAWITHCSIQRQDLYRSAECTDAWRTQYGKPVVLDEIAYEGDIQHGWGNLTGEEMVRRFWEGAVRGGYPGHGETVLCDNGILWWSHGGPLRGESWKRVKFLLRIMKETPGGWLCPVRSSWDDVSAVPENRTAAAETGYQLWYYSFMRPSFREFDFADGAARHVQVIDTWNMTVEDIGDFSGRFRVPLGAKQYMAIRMWKL